MHILTLTSLFPNTLQPLHGIFVRNRMENFTRGFGHKWSVVAPVIYYPKLPFPTLRAYDIQARVPAREERPGYAVAHPRYLVTPKVGMRFYGSWMSRGARDAVRRIHAEHPIDVIDGHYVYPDGVAAVELGRELGIPVILSARGTDLNLFPRFPAVRERIAATLSACHHLICVCTDLKTVALELGIHPDKVSVIGNGVDIERFQRTDQAAARKALGLPASATLLLAVGHMTERKGFHILIEALARMRAGQGKDVRLAIAGDGPQMGELKAATQRLGLAGRVIFPGAVRNEDLPAWYNAADIFTLASSREGWPNVVCEAQATGLPVVATAVWGIPEIVSTPELGILVAERTPDAFAAAMDAALARRWDRDAITAKGRSRTWENVSQALQPLFTSVRGGKGKA